MIEATFRPCRKLWLQHAHIIRCRREPTAGGKSNKADSESASSEATNSDPSALTDTSGDPSASKDPESEAYTPKGTTSDEASSAATPPATSGDSTVPGEAGLPQPDEVATAPSGAAMVLSSKAFAAAMASSGKAFVLRAEAEGEGAGGGRHSLVVGASLGCSQTCGGGETLYPLNSLQLRCTHLSAHGSMCSICPNEANMWKRSLSSACPNSFTELMTLILKQCQKVYEKQLCTQELADENSTCCSFHHHLLQSVLLAAPFLSRRHFVLITSSQSIHHRLAPWQVFRQENNQLHGGRLTNLQDLGISVMVMESV